MALETWFHAVIPGDSQAQIAAAARRHLGQLDGHVVDAPAGPIEARWLLEALAGNGGSFRGGTATWGIIGNYTVPDAVVAQLVPFIAEVLPRDARALFFCEDEEHTARGFEILRSDGPSPHVTVGGLIVRRFELPFRLDGRAGIE